MAESKIFSFNCSLPPDGSHFVSNPAVRGTLDIVWSCLGVILLSTWQTVGINWNIPEMYNLTKRGSLAHKVKRFAERIFIFVVVMIVPEVAAVLAIQTHFEARAIFKKGLSLAQSDGVDWDVSKAYYMGMGGFRVEFDKPQPAKGSAIELTKYPGGSEEELLPSRDGIEDTGNLLSGEVSVKPGVPDPVEARNASLIYLRQQGVLASMPVLSCEELNDRNKSNALVETLALVQTVWIVLQVIVRAFSHLFITQLEVMTLAFATLGLIARAFDWRRPKDVATVTTLYAARNITLQERKFVGEMGSPAGWVAEYGMPIIAGCAGALFGGLHCIAWSEPFPTPIEQTLWRVCAFLTTALPLVFPIGVYVNLQYSHFIYVWAFSPLLAIYSLARLFIIVESVRAVFFLPPDAFRATWSVNFPHFG